MKVPTFVLQADDPAAMRALYAYGNQLEKPSPERDAFLDVVLEFSKWRDAQVAAHNRENEL